MTMDNARIAENLRRIAHLLEIKGENPFKVSSYEKAAEAISSFPQELSQISGELPKIPGVGESISAKIKELIATGKIKYLADLEKEIPSGLLEMLKIQGMGPKKIKAVWQHLGIKDIRGLEIAARKGKLAGLEGFGKKTEENILKGIELATRYAGRILSSTAAEVSGYFLKWLSERKCEAFVCGSFRRGCETIGDIDILATNASKKIMDEFVKNEKVSKILSSGPTKSSVITERNIQVDLRIVPKKSFGSAIMYFTGSKNHNIHLREIAQRMGYKLNEYGLFSSQGEKFVAGKTEEEIYRKLKMQFIPPEIRENSGEIEAALSGKIPTLVERKDIKGDLHIHSTWSDGVNTIQEIAQEAQKYSYEWVVISDHSVSLKVAKGLSVEDLLKKKKEIEELNKTSPVKILFGAEVDILPDGILDYPDEILSQLDVCIGALHSNFNQSQEVLMKRIFRAFENPHLDIFAHPSVRLIGKREAIPIDFEALIKKAKERGVVLEVNVFPDRMDLRDIYIRSAIEEGVKVSLGTDSHSISHMSFMDYGVKYIRRGWAKKEDVLNTMSWKDLKKFLDRKK